MSFIRSVSVSLPKFRYSSAEVLNAIVGWLPAGSTENQFFTRVVHNSKIDTRYFAVPIEEIFGLARPQEKVAILSEEGRMLLHRAVEGLPANSFAWNKLQAIISSSCSLPLLPSLESLSFNQNTDASNVLRLPFYQHGCIGGVVGLSLASRLANTGPVLVMACELCSLVHRQDDRELESLVGAALFSDGAGAMLVDQEGPLQIIDTESFLIPETTNHLGYELREHGSHLRLSSELPDIIIKQLPKVVSRLLSRHDLSPQNIDHWLLHPGGIKIISGIEQSFNLRECQTFDSRSILQNHGNMSSVAIFHVINNFLNRKISNPMQHALIIGIGPGITLEVLLIRCS